jgi:hypothetical protein
MIAPLIALGLFGSFVGGMVFAYRRRQWEIDAVVTCERQDDPDGPNEQQSVMRYQIVGEIRSPLPPVVAVLTPLSPPPDE